MIRSFDITPREHYFIERFIYEFCNSRDIPNSVMSYNKNLFLTKYFQVMNYNSKFDEHEQTLKDHKIDSIDRNRIHLINLEYPILTKAGKCNRLGFRLNDKMFTWMYEEITYWVGHSNDSDDKHTMMAGKRILRRMEKILTVQDRRDVILDNLLN